MDTVRWIALVAALMLIVPASIRIVAVLWPRAGDVAPAPSARTLDAVWTVVPFALLIALVALTVGAG